MKNSVDVDKDLDVPLPDIQTGGSSFSNRLQQRSCVLSCRGAAVGSAVLKKVSSCFA